MIDIFDDWFASLILSLFPFRVFWDGGIFFLFYFLSKWVYSLSVLWVSLFPKEFLVYFFFFPTTSLIWLFDYSIPIPSLAPAIPPLINCSPQFCACLLDLPSTTLVLLACLLACLLTCCPLLAWITAMTVMLNVHVCLRSVCAKVNP